jgi:hypothetical protein
MPMCANARVEVAHGAYELEHSFTTRGWVAGQSFDIQRVWLFRSAYYSEPAFGYADGSWGGR